MTFKSYRDESRINWGREDVSLSQDDLKLGTLMRIADACELMAKDRERMERELRWKRDRVEHLERENDRLGRSNAALRGVIKRMKREAANT